MIDDGIVIDGLLVIWRSADAANIAAIEQDYDLETIDSFAEFRVSQSTTGRLGGALLDALRSDPRVLSVEPNFVADTPEAFGHSWAFDDGVLDGPGYEDQGIAVRLGLDPAHGVSRGNGVLVAILDTGVNADHPLLAGRVIAGRDYVDDDTDASDRPDSYDSDLDGQVDEALGHGTHVAGIVALVAPDARILPIRVLDNDGRGSLLAIARGITYAVWRGARVINLSLGSLAQSDLLQFAIDNAIAQGAVVIASAGNWGAEEPLEYPANSRNVIAVAATDSADAAAPFTSYGPFVSVCAPGVGVRSSYWNGNTAIWSGSSMSSGFASGASALLLSVHPEWRRSDVRTRLVETATPLVGATYASMTAGRIDIGAALGVVPASAEVPVPPAEEPTPAPVEEPTAPVEEPTPAPVEEPTAPVEEPTASVEAPTAPSDPAPAGDTTAPSDPAPAGDTTVPSDPAPAGDTSATDSPSD
jgi:subtilisin family serine protease